ncbi:MAG: hypothetical protein ACYC2T_07100 [Bacillota bacterium]
MLEELENTIQSFFAQYGISTKSTINEMNDTDRVAKLLAYQIFLHTINKETQAIGKTSGSKAAVTKPTTPKTTAPKATGSKTTASKSPMLEDSPLLKTKRQYNRKTKGAIQ